MNRLVCLPILLLAAAPAAAEPIVSTASTGNMQAVRVSYADLNLNSEMGMARLDSRLRAAARQVCDVRPDVEPLRHKIATSRCFDAALERGRESGREVIAAYRSGRTLAALAITVAKP